MPLVVSHMFVLPVIPSPVLSKSLCSSYAFALWPFDRQFENFITNSYKIKKMQIRYQNVQKNITYMSVSFAFMKKVLESAHPSFSSFDTTMNSKI